MFTVEKQITLALPRQRLSKHGLTMLMAIDSFLQHTIHYVVLKSLVSMLIRFTLMRKHNSVKRNFHPATEHFSSAAERCYFFTATPKHSVAVSKPGMNNYKTYGNIICNVPAPKLVDEGYILPPKVVVNQLPQGDFKMSDCDNLISTIDDNSLTRS